MQKRKDTVVRQNNDGIVYLFRKNKVTFFTATARSSADSAGGGWKIAVEGRKPPSSRHARDRRDRLEAAAAAGRGVRQQTGARQRGRARHRQVPKRLGVVGAGVIGLEMGSVWRRLGAQRRCSKRCRRSWAADDAVAKEASRVFARQGLVVACAASDYAGHGGAGDVAVEYTDAAGVAQSATFDRLIVAIGRLPHTAGSARRRGVQLDERGFVDVDAECRTNLPNVWAIGDVVRGPMLAHKAEEEGVAVAERIAGQHGHVDFNTIPWVIYTSPEIAWVGKTEQQLKAEG